MAFIEERQHYTPDEYGTSLRIIDDHRKNLRWCESIQRWLVSDRRPGLWTVDDMVDHLRKAMDTAMRQDTDNPESRVNFLSVAHTKNALALAKPALACQLAVFDTEPWMLNTPGGLLNLRTGRMEAHSGLYMMQTRVTPATIWEPKDTPNWISHLNRMCKGNAEIMEFLRVLAGISLIGDQNLKPHLSPQLNGLGRNGKGVFCQGLLYGLGDYGYSASSRLLTAKENEHTTEQASLRSKRMVVVEEVKRINSSLLKDLTGGGMKSARRMRADDSTFLKTWTLWFNNNGPMMFSGDMSDGLWERVPRIDFGTGIPRDERIDDYVMRIQEEASGILAWAVQGCIEFQAYGVCIPESVRNDTDERKLDADPLKQFLNELYERDHTSMVNGNKFIKDYTAWARDRGEQPGGMRAIYDELRTRFNLPVKAGHQRRTFIHGIKARPLSMADLEEQYGTQN